jgi:hypothetical protein
MVEEDLETKLLVMVKKGDLTPEEAKALLERVRPSAPIPKKNRRGGLIISSLLVLASLVGGYYLSKHSTNKNYNPPQQTSITAQEQETPQYQEPQTQETQQIPQLDQEISSKYTSIDYYDLGSWANAGDLELLVTEHELKKKRFYGANSRDYMGWMLYVPTTVKNISENSFVFSFLGNINLAYSGQEKRFDEDEFSRINSGLDCTEIPPGGEVTRTLPFWVSDYNSISVSLVIPKLQNSREHGHYTEHTGKTYINLLELQGVTSEQIE